MTTAIVKSILLVGTTAVLFSLDLPKGWHKSGSKPNQYDMGIERETAYNSRSAATIKSIEKVFDGFGTLMQICIAGPYAGKKIRMSGYMKTKDVDSAWFWLRSDAVDSTSEKDSVITAMLALANMHERTIKGTTDWTRYDIVMDISPNASHLAFGAGLSGTGQMWFDNISFEIVDNTVTTTETITPDAERPGFKIPRERFQKAVAQYQPQPTNLDFEE